MSEQPPPYVQVPIFNNLNFRGATGNLALAAGGDQAPNKLDFPVAQGSASFPDGVQYPDGTRQDRTYTGYVDQAGTFVNANVTLSENGQIVNMSAAAKSYYDINWELDHTSLMNDPRFVNFNDTPNEGVIDGSGAGVDTTSEAIYYLPSTPKVNSVLHPTEIVFTPPEKATVSLYGTNQADVSLNISADIVGETSSGAPITVTQPSTYNFNITDGEVNIFGTNSAQVVVNSHTGNYVFGQGSTYQWTGVNNFNYIPASPNPLGQGTGNPNQMGSPWTIQIPIMYVLGTFPDGTNGSYFCSAYGPGQTLTFDLIDNLILQRSASSGLGAMEWYENNYFMGQIALLPGQMIANYAASKSTWQPVSGVYPMTNNDYVDQTLLTTSDIPYDGPFPCQAQPYYPGCLNNFMTNNGTSFQILYTPQPSFPQYNSYDNYTGSNTGGPWPGWWADGIGQKSAASQNAYPYGGEMVTVTTGPTTGIDYDPPNFFQQQFTWEVSVTSTSNFEGMARDQLYGNYVGGAPSYFTPTTSSIAKGTYFSGLVLNVQPRCPVFGASTYQYNGNSCLYSTKRFSKLKLTGCPKMQASNKSPSPSLKIPMCRIKYGGYTNADDGETDNGNYVTPTDSTTYADVDYSTLSNWAIKLSEVVV